MLLFFLTITNTRSKTLLPRNGAEEFKCQWCHNDEFVSSAIFYAPWDAMKNDVKLS